MRFFNYIYQNNVRVGFENCGKKYSIPFECDMNKIIINFSDIKKVLEPKASLELHGKIKYAPAVLSPQKILCIGLNYENHVGELKEKMLTVPTVFGKYNNALSAHGETVPLPYKGGHYDYEAELVIVIGKKCKNVTSKDADDYIFGYTAGNDLSVREVQNSTSQWLLGKSFDKFAPIGPCIVTKDSIDVSDLKIQSRVNGEVRQNSSTKNMIFSCPQIVSHISKYMTLLPGDVIFTGTPGGVMAGYPEDKQIWLQSGDKVDVEIEKIGVLTTFFS